MGVCVLEPRQNLQVPTVSGYQVPVGVALDLGVQAPRYLIVPGLSFTQLLTQPVYLKLAVGVGKVGRDWLKSKKGIATNSHFILKSP
jgi:hypothetical protein